MIVYVIQQNDYAVTAYKNKEDARERIRLERSKPQDPNQPRQYFHIVECPLVTEENEPRQGIQNLLAGRKK
jgi:hypothetical protein